MQLIIFIQQHDHKIVMIQVFSSKLLFILLCYLITKKLIHWQIFINLFSKLNHIISKILFQITQR